MMSTASAAITLALCLLTFQRMIGAPVCAYSPPNHHRNESPTRQQHQQHHQQPSQPQTDERRSFFVKTAAMVSAASLGLLVGQPQEASAIISSKYCAYGEGDGCDDLAEGNEYIKQLQARSAANKESIQREAKNAFYMKNYPDWFATVGKTMVKRPDGSFVVLDDAELAELKAQNRIGVEYATAMGGRVTDLTQKPILVLKE
jgi:hypothetical protein